MGYQYMNYVLFKDRDSHNFKREVLSSMGIEPDYDKGSTWGYNLPISFIDENRTFLNEDYNNV